MVVERVWAVVFTTGVDVVVWDVVGVCFVLLLLILIVVVCVNCFIVMVVFVAVMPIVRG